MALRRLYDSAVSSDRNSLAKGIQPCPSSLKASVWEHFGFYCLDGKTDIDKEKCYMQDLQNKREVFRKCVYLSNICIILFFFFVFGQYSTSKSSSFTNIFYFALGSLWLHCLQYQLLRPAICS